MLRPAPLIELNSKIAQPENQTNLLAYLLEEQKAEDNISMYCRIKKEAQGDHTYFSQYFNYDINPDTWNLLVNKQIYMTFERLFIEKQMTEKKKKELEIKSKIEKLNKETQ